MALDSMPEAVAFRFPRKGGFTVRDNFTEETLGKIATATEQVARLFAETLPAIVEATESED
jgi:hypothetical protein